MEKTLNIGNSNITIEFSDIEYKADIEYETGNGYGMVELSKSEKPIWKPVKFETLISEEQFWVY